MANGAYHGKKKHGVNIKNPLALPVQVRVKSETGALRTGDGKETWRIIRPGDTIYIPLKGSAEIDVEVHIIRYDETGRENRVGKASWEHTGHKASTGGKDVPARPVPDHVTEETGEKEPVEEVEIRSLGEMIEDMKKEEVPV